LAHLVAIDWGRELVPPWAEALGNKPVGGEKALGMPWGFKPLHAPFPLPRRLVGILGAVVQIAVLAMFHARQDLLFGCAIAAEFIRDDDPWRIRQALQ
jgi:hypothetical protein